MVGGEGIGRPRWVTLLPEENEKAKGTMLLRAGEGVATTHARTP